MPPKSARLAELRTLQPGKCLHWLSERTPYMKEIHISVNGIIKLLQGLKPDKAPGPDRIKPLLLQKLCLEIAPIMKVIFSRSLDDGSLPPDWFKANVSPVFKKGEKSSPSNYRPISLTCILCKILEHIITSNTVKHFDDNKILYDFQHGFLAKRSCETQPIMLVEELHQNMRAGKQTDVYCLISVKRLIVNHEKLIYKLHGYGMRGNTLTWIKAFLNGRSQTVVLEGDCSEEVPVISGVLQGSVFGPILLGLYKWPARQGKISDETFCRWHGCLTSNN